MSNPNLKPSLRMPVIAALKSDTHAADSTYPTGAVDMGAHINIMAVLAVGAITGSGTVEFEQATTDVFSDAKAIEGRTAVDLVAEKPVQLNLKANELDVNNGFRYVRAKLTTVGGSVKTGILVLSADAKDQPFAPLTGTIVD
ncbi:hypothetical protein [Thalassolituus sp.]|uniref:hypothetical protein n=1 Tax=Thalassolituus sp. TaxID=2030822 RepID=UPI00260841F8|nr:hypothetical protein [Thalassolituus sp.]